MYSATGDGKIPFVAAEDIAAVAHHALVDEKSHDCFHNILGSELLSYDDVRFPFSFPSAILFSRPFLVPSSPPLLIPILSLSPPPSLNNQLTPLTNRQQPSLQKSLDEILSMFICLKKI